MSVDHGMPLAEKWKGKQRKWKHKRKIHLFSVKKCMKMESL